jgi:heme oxygenase
MLVYRKMFNQTPRHQPLKERAGYQPTLPQCADLPAIATLPSGVGCLYVLEGSTLGGQIISRRIASCLQVREESGGAFFCAYGDAVGQRWSEFKEFTNSHINHSGVQETIKAALQTFEALLAWLGC